jgi:exopolysaccharide biosynthesis WecB/TagA/CpsF family protein
MNYHKSSSPDLMIEPERNRSVVLLGLDFADLDISSAAALLASRPASAPFTYVVTPNADHLVRLHGRPELVQIYRDALLRLMDSRVVARAARLIGLPVPQVATGSDLTAELLGRYIRPGEPVTIIGLRRNLVPALAAKFGLSKIAHFDPPMGFDRNPAQVAEAARFVEQHPARFIFLAVGSPRQERLSAAVMAGGRATGIGLCIGASLEFLAGSASRAPGWMQVAGLEWLFRLAGDPGRMVRRYLLDDPQIFAMLLRERLTRIRSRELDAIHAGDS